MFVGRRTLLTECEQQDLGNQGRRYRWPWQFPRLELSYGAPDPNPALATLLQPRTMPRWLSRPHSFVLVQLLPVSSCPLYFAAFPLWKPARVPCGSFCFSFYIPLFVKWTFFPPLPHHDSFYGATDRAVSINTSSVHVNYRTLRKDHGDIYVKSCIPHH